jgi:hypothetical protein
VDSIVQKLVEETVPIVPQQWELTHAERQTAVQKDRHGQPIKFTSRTRECDEHLITIGLTNEWNWKSITEKLGKKVGIREINNKSD